ncbi:MAG: ATP-binding cassette domain-containing protein [Deltaproteobacteria bacterium]|nr:ATP-binding cassette domain-containing protein [Deltaproteobacteria bacterium]
MIAVEKVTKKYGPHTAVQDLQFSIGSGEVVGFLGPNGAGKSTTLRLLTGYLRPSSGVVKINGRDVSKDPVSCQKLIGYLPESSALYNDMFVFDFLEFMGKMHGLNKATLLKRIQFVAEKCQLQDVLDRKLWELSKGYRQRVGLAQALIHDPKILILDEPTVGLDPNQIREIRTLIKDIGKDKTVLLSSHILSEVALTCDRVIIINKGKLVAQGHPDQLLQNSEDQEYQVCIQGDLKTIQTHFQNDDRFVSFELIQSQNDWHAFRLVSKTPTDLSEEIFDVCVANAWRLKQLTHQKRSLEDVFQALTAA